MSAPARQSASFVLALAACGLACARPTEVELRLHPCTALTPVRVLLDIQGYDAAGEPLAPLHAEFEIGGARVLADGIATVGLRKPDGLVEADFTLTWVDAQDVAEVVTHTGLAVPDVGEILELGADGCAPVDGETGTSSGSSGDGTSSSSGDGTTGDATTGSSSGDDTTSTSSSSSDDTTTTGDGSSTTDATDTSTGDNTTGEASMLGMPCGGDDLLYCEGSGPGKAGVGLRCDGKNWQLADLVSLCETLTDYCPVGSMINPFPVGCTAHDDHVTGFACICAEDPKVPCVQANIGCEGLNQITLCTDDGDEQQLKGLCVGECYDDGGGPFCKDG